MMPTLLLAVAGLALLALGRRLFWLFVGVAGFAAGLQAASLLLTPAPFWLLWTAGLVGGVVGALLALFFQHLAIAVGGFLAGGIAAGHLVQLMGRPPEPLILLVGGILGAVVLYLLFDWALIGLSSLVGATLVVDSLNPRPSLALAAFLTLFVIGALFQAGWLLRTRRRDD